MLAENQPGVVEQLIYTWSAAGLNGQPGYGVRAASPGLSDMYSERYQKLSPYLPYQLPPGVRTGQLALAGAPVCLAFLKGDSRRILLHKQYTGTDALERQGIYVTHLLAGLPQDFSAREAILLWHAHASDLWITDRNALKPQILAPIPVGRLSELQQQAWHRFSLADAPPGLRQVLALFLRDPPPGRVYLCGPSEAIALTIWCITQCLPRQLLKSLTFTTYEDNVAYSREKIVGLTPSQQIPSLPPGFFSVDLAMLSASVGIPAPVDEYLNFALLQLARRSQGVPEAQDRLVAFLDQAEAQKIEQAGALLTLFAQSQARFLPPEEIPLLPTQALSPSENPPRGDDSPPPVLPPPLSAATLLQRVDLSRISLSRLSLGVNVLLLLCVLVLLFFRSPSPPPAQGTAAQATQQARAQLTSAAAHGNEVSLVLLGVHTQPDPITPGNSLSVSIIIQNQGTVPWLAQQGFYLACVPAAPHPADADCQAISGGRQKAEPGSASAQMEQIQVPAGLVVSPHAFSTVTFTLTVLPLAKNDQQEFHHIILRIGRGSQLLGGSITAYFTVVK
ncbi:MAG TPA: hypothetical protein VGF67_08000 [Ktedonobacteraceae bacterium]|jgi:hypothetical protein